MVNLVKSQKNAEYIQMMLSPLRVCMSYKPKFGHSKKEGGFSLEEFREMYQKDSFYTWLGLDSPLMYSAHKAAGGITSIYRQIGKGCERLFNKIIQDNLGISEESASWSYIVSTSGGKSRTLTLDARIASNDLSNDKKKAFDSWLAEARRKVGLASATRLVGAVFEVRQGYKSKDSKRQNADIANASNAYSHDYLPVFALLSSQIDDDVYDRYLSANWLILRGLPGSNDPYESVYAFSKQVLGYDLAGFFERNSPRIKSEIEKILTRLLSAR